MEAGADVAHQNRVGYTALHVAAGWGHGVQAAAALLRHGADINSRASSYGRGQTPLHVGAYQAGTQADAGKMVEYLLREGADETAVDNLGWSALDLAGTKEYGQHLSRQHDLERVRKILTNASADRSWRRRGLLILCRAHPDRVRLHQEHSGPHVSARTRSRRRAQQQLTPADTDPADARSDNDLGIVAAKVVRLEADEVFLTIVGYL